MRIDQTSSQAIVNWNSFSIGSGASVNFRQPGSDAVILNRVVGDNPSEIFGSMTSNGQVFLLNASGVTFHQGSSVNVGSLVAGTMSLSDEDFLAGNYRFTRNGATAGVLNEGHIVAAQGGLVALLGSTVENRGVIKARLGRVAMASGEAVTLSFSKDELWNIALDPSEVESIVRNSGTISADGGTVTLSASAATGIASSIVNDGGVIQARTIGEHDGVIRLMGDMENGSVQVGGTIDSGGSTAVDRAGTIEVSGAFVAMGGTVSADGATGGTIDVKAAGTLSLAETVRARGLAGAGGDIRYRAGYRITEISSSLTDVSGKTDGGTITINSGYGVASSGIYKASGLEGLGGRIDLTAPDVRLLSSTFEATGKTQGGLIRIGGAFQGGSTADASASYYSGFVGRWGALPTLSHASQTFVNSGVNIDVSSSSGTGGTAIVWSDDMTTFLGSVDASGGSKGGTVEISSAGDLRRVELMSIDPGTNGTLLLDPKNITIGSNTETVKSWNYAGIMGAFYGGPASSSKDLTLSLDPSGAPVFGASVALSGDGKLLAVGATGINSYDQRYRQSGAVYLFKFTDTDFAGGSLVETIGSGYSINVPELADGDAFGYSVALNDTGKLLAVGAYSDDGLNDASSNAGAVYLFRLGYDKDNGTYTSGNSARLGIIGYGYTNQNSAETAPLPINSGDNFSYSVALSDDGTWLAVGANGDDSGNSTNTAEGAVHLIKLKYDDTNGTYGGWDHQAKIGKGYDVNVDLGEGDFFGSSVALNGDASLVAIGAYRDDAADNSGSDRGAVYLYRLNYDTHGNFGSGSQLSIIGSGYSVTTGTYNYNLSALSNADYFGRSVALNNAGTLLAVGAFGEDGGFGNNTISNTT
ncbi:MAG: filamentous hemagglutinin N-terminal domain-containing protein, partial [Chlorobiales bacterium]|nr:filamentous hemagglutinin N-terminal domain-containing protein [Chlorobiales bacterium]